MSSKKASEQLEEKLVKLTFDGKAKGWENFDKNQFEKDAQKVKDTFTEEDGTVLPQRNY